ncbi:MAG: hypothetical protein DSM106950_27335 [Stigonema ocellatum SAG 48.90 = DSM 106950]|nr:hypothetical protein [Stigonema ocellatum SAG 48.90 = DSM 106950]
MNEKNTVFSPTPLHPHTPTPSLPHSPLPTPPLPYTLVFLTLYQWLVVSCLYNQK